jgi:hypothetical protein
MAEITANRKAQAFDQREKPVGVIISIDGGEIVATNIEVEA